MIINNNNNNNNDNTTRSSSWEGSASFPSLVLRRPAGLAERRPGAEAGARSGRGCPSRAAVAGPRAFLNSGRAERQRLLGARVCGRWRPALLGEPAWAGPAVSGKRRKSSGPGIRRSGHPEMRVLGCPGSTLRGVTQTRTPSAFPSACLASPLFTSLYGYLLLFSSFADFLQQFYLFIN